MFCHIPKSGQQFGLIEAGNELDRSGLGLPLRVIGCGEQHLSASGVCVKHGDAHHLGGKRPEAALLLDFGPPRRPGRFFRDLLALAKKILLLRLVKPIQRQGGSFDIENELGHQAPNLSNILAFACIKRMRYLASNNPNDPQLAPVSVNRSSLSEPQQAEFSKTGCGCHECPFIRQGVEWSPVIARTSGLLRSKIGKAASSSSIAFRLAVKLPSSPCMSVYL